jgi:hypothetical protein
LAPVDRPEGWAEELVDVVADPLADEGCDVVVDPLPDEGFDVVGLGT